MQVLSGQAGGGGALFFRRRNDIGIISRSLFFAIFSRCIFPTTNLNTVSKLTGALSASKMTEPAQFMP
jgi:hypothetical protein